MSEARQPTEYGILVRVLRASKNLRLSHMARSLGVSSSYLSAVELGRAALTEDLLQKVINYFKEQGVPTDKLEQIEARPTVFARLSLPDSTPLDRELVQVFARKARDLSEEKKRAILRMLEEDDDTREGNHDLRAART